jgi:hypothetical protein
MPKKQSKIVFKKGIARINFPVMFVGDFRDEIRKVERMKLPKYRVIGFEARYYEGNKNYPPFSNLEVFIEK